ncbi:flagellar hook-length control protein FliK [Shewanella sp. CG12_big_fil_rev_8_21_14_0_65_47_15]|uniref:flagellar hook-length control protein FliK n=1 Tax=Shewanella sp. CG12_big_fil_rev_8_21_14_0_65_47_15 TaxID=1975537 RepID=UPI0025F4DEF4|nr:flagellar hook-length control protein FliK [Shewanella sp. CG12_big_fil_rev_8_21_14_0_65_47_15]
MQQMTNILLAKPGLNGTGSSKTLTQDANSEDFSAALASMNSTPSKALKSSTSAEIGEAPTKVETANDVQPDDEKDINLIFAQIGMASEMKKAAAQGDNLPLEVAGEQNIDTELIETACDVTMMGSLGNTATPADTDSDANLDIDADMSAASDDGADSNSVKGNSAKGDLAKDDSVKGDFSAELMKLSKNASAAATVTVSDVSDKPQINTGTIVGDASSTLAISTDETDGVEQSAPQTKVPGFGASASNLAEQNRTGAVESKGAVDMAEEASVSLISQGSSQAQKQEGVNVFPTQSENPAANIERGNISLDASLDKTDLKNIGLYSKGLDGNKVGILPIEDDKFDVMSVEAKLNSSTGKQAGGDFVSSSQFAVNASAVADSRVSNVSQDIGIKPLTTDASTQPLNILGTEPINGEQAQDETASAEIKAGLILKDAKLAVTLETRQETTLLNRAEEDTASTTELKPTEFKPVSTLASTTGQPQINRQDLQQVQLSLRQGVETQNQMQEMIQRFSPVMKQQLVTMVSQGIQHAEIRLDPPELGHMLVKIQVHGDQTQVQFHVTQPQTRDVIEQAIPRLRELLQEQGMQLADSHVSHGDQGQRREGSFGEGGGSGGANVDNFSAEELDLGLNQATSLNSGIDYYA